MATGSGKNTGTDLVPITDYAVSRVETNVLDEILRENVGRTLTEFDLTRVKVPTGGMTAWQVPTLDGDDNIVQTLDGIIVYHREPRAFWKVAFAESGGGTPPDCASKHGEVGVGDPGIECDRCPNAVWGSKPPGPGQTESRGQACKQMKLICLLRPESLLPTALFLPPTSVKPARQYLLGLASEAQHYASVQTRISLVKSKSADGIDYAQAKFSRASVLSPDETTKIRAYSDSIRAALDTIEVTSEDVPDGA